MSSKKGHEDKRRTMDRGQGDRRVTASRRVNKVGRVDSSNLIPSTDRRAQENQKPDKEDSTD
jgi:hypothetical protein